MVRDLTEEGEHDFHVGVRQAELARLPLRDGFVLEDEGHRHADLEVARVQSLQERKGRPAPRAQAGDDDIRVENDVVDHVVSYTIPACG